MTYSNKLCGFTHSASNLKCCINRSVTFSILTVLLVLIVIKYSIIVCQAIARLFMRVMLQSIILDPIRCQKTCRDKRTNS